MAWDSENIIMELYCLGDMMKIWHAWWCYDDKKRSSSTSFKNTNILLFVSQFYMYFCSFGICISICISIFIVFLLHDKRRSSSTSPRNANILLSSLTLCTALHFCHICICFIFVFVSITYFFFVDLQNCHKNQVNAFSDGINICIRHVFVFAKCLYQITICIAILLH